MNGGAILYRNTAKDAAYLKNQNLQVQLKCTWLEVAKRTYHAVDFFKVLEEQRVKMKEIGKTGKYSNHDRTKKDCGTCG